MTSFQKRSTQTEPAVISPDLEMTGDMTFRSPGIMLGKLKGKLHSRQDIRIGESGAVEGSVVCKDCEVFGAVHGEVRAKGHIRILGEVKGPLVSSSLEITPSAHVESAFNIGNASLLRMARQRLSALFQLIIQKFQPKETS